MGEGGFPSYGRLTVFDFHRKEIDKNLFNRLSACNRHKSNQVFTFNMVSSGEILVDEVYHISKKSGIIRQALSIISQFYPHLQHWQPRQHFGSWTTHEKLKTSEVTHWERRKDLRGHKFRFGHYNLCASLIF